jgi:uncharacterized protein
MKRGLVVIALVVAATSAAGQDQRTVKRDLIRELLNVIDAKALTQSSFDMIFARLEQPQSSEAMKTMSEGDRARYEASMKQRSEQMHVYRDKLYARIDYVKYAEDIYAPILDKTYNVDELREIIAFYKTPVGQKNAKVMAEFAVGSLMRGGEMIAEAEKSVREEMQNEDKSAHPWKSTMADLRTVATATEAFATDENKYPAVQSFSDLKPILSPTYIKTMPEKDAWGTPYLYVVSSDGQHYRFVSAGADRRFDFNATTIAMLPENIEGKASENLDDDIIFEDGRFIQFPAASAASQQ